MLSELLGNLRYGLTHDISKGNALCRASLERTIEIIAVVFSAAPAYLLLHHQPHMTWHVAADVVNGRSPQEPGAETKSSPAQNTPDKKNAGGNHHRTKGTADGQDVAPKVFFPNNQNNAHRQCRQATQHHH